MNFVDAEGNFRQRRIARQMKHWRNVRRQILDKAATKRRKGKSVLTWPQVDSRDELAALIGAEALAKANAAPPERDE